MKTKWKIISDISKGYKKEYRYIYLPDGNVLVIKFDEDGIVYDLYNNKEEHTESFGYDLYEEINLTKNNN